MCVSGSLRHSSQVRKLACFLPNPTVPLTLPIGKTPMGREIAPSPLYALAPMTRYIVRRLLQAIPLLFLISLVLFILMQNVADPKIGRAHV